VDARLASRYSRSPGHPLDRNQLDEVYARFTELADRKKSIHDQDLLGLLQPGESIPTATVSVHWLHLFHK